MTLPTVFYIPHVLRSDVPAFVPASVAFFQSGLDSEGLGQGAVSSVERQFATRLPLSPSEAKATLREMLSLAGEQAKDGVSLKQHSLLQHVLSPVAPVSSAEELASLDSFAKNGELPLQPEKAKAAPEPRDVLIDCQKVLLLAQELEIRRKEVAAAHAHSVEAEKKLLHALHGEESDELFDMLGQEGFQPLQQLPQAVPWRIILDAALAFTPESAIFFTAAPDVAIELKESGMLQPFPEDRAEVCSEWPQDLVNGLLLASLPAWRLVGRRECPIERPWLARELEIFVARPAQGWSQQNSKEELGHPEESKGGEE